MIQSWLSVNGFSSVRPFWKGFLVLYNFYYIQPEVSENECNFYGNPFFLYRTYLNLPKKIINKRDERDNIVGCMTFNCFWAIKNFQLTLMTK